MNKSLSEIEKAAPTTALGSDASPRDASSFMIPKRIIQTAKTAEQPLRFRAMISSIKLLHPDFEYMFFDNKAVDDFIQSEFPQYWQIFKSFPYPIQRYDFFRYLAVFRFGGFYFDTDILLAKEVSSLLDSGCVFPFEGLTMSRYLRDRHGIDWEIGNYAFGAAPGHPFLAAVIENCVRGQKDPRWMDAVRSDAPLMFRSEFEVLYTTGPGLLTRTLAENPELARTVTVLFPDDVCDDENWNRFGDFGIHFMEASWRKKSSHITRRIAQRWEYHQFKKFLAESLALGKTRQLGVALPSSRRPTGAAATIVAKVQGRLQRMSARHLHRRMFDVRPKTPIISFTFDDFPRSALLTAGQILKSHGAAGTYYASLGLMGKQSDTGTMMLESDLKATVEQGHELGCHTYGHCHAWNTSPAEFEASIVENRQALDKLIPGAKFKSLSYPIGTPKARTKAASSRHFACSRGGGQTFNFGPTDLNLLSSYFLEQSRDDPSAIEQMIDETCARGGWLIFATHDVCENPTRWGCTPALFQRIVEYSVKSGARILPVHEAYEAILAESAAAPRT